MGANADPTVCKDRYCDANSVCGVACVEIDLMEANRNAFVATVHTADDSSGESFGMGHYVKHEHRFIPGPGTACAYGPRDSCTINTHHRFTARYAFAPEGTAFSVAVSLEQEGRRVTLPQPMRYVDAPQHGDVTVGVALHLHCSSIPERG